MVNRPCWILKLAVAAPPSPSVYADVVNVKAVRDGDDDGYVLFFVFLTLRMKLKDAVVLYVGWLYPNNVQVRT